MVPKVIAALSVATAVAVALSACASRAVETPLRTGAVTIAALRAAPDAVTDAGSGRFAMQVEVDGADRTGVITSTGVFARGRVAMEIDLGAVLTSALSEVGESAPDGLGGPAQMVIDGDTAYLRVAAWEDLFGGFGWLSISPEDLGATRQSVGFDVGSLDPTGLVDTLRDISEHVEEIGHEQVRGVSTTHVTATIDPDQEIEVWIDGDGLLRRLRIDVDSGDPGIGTVTTSVELFDYGAPLEVVVPSPAETTPFGDVVRAFFGAGR